MYNISEKYNNLSLSVNLSFGTNSSYDYFNKVAKVLKILKHQLIPAIRCHHLHIYK